MANYSIKSLDHIVIRAIDLENMTRFYCEVLGCSLDKTNERLSLVHLRAGASLIDLISVAGELGKAGGAAPGKEGRNQDHFCLRIDPFDYAALQAHFAQHGVSVGELHNNYGAEGDGHSVYLNDPEGNVIELKGAAFSA